MFLGVVVSNRVVCDVEWSMMEEGAFSGEKTANT